jgi:hypothetical protein
VNYLPMMMPHQPTQQPAQGSRAFGRRDVARIGDADRADPGFYVKYT